MQSETGIKLAQQAKQARADGNHEKARQLEAEADLYLNPVKCVEIGAGNEALPERTTGIEGYQALQIKNTLESPSQINLDASQVRMELLDQVGTLQQGLDVAESIDAKNTVEKMLAHQAAACHKIALDLLAAAEQYRPTGTATEKRERLMVDAQTRHFNTACRLMDTFQRSIATLQKLRTKGQEVVSVQHVIIHNAGDNSQTLIRSEGGVNDRE